MLIKIEKKTLDLRIINEYNEYNEYSKENLQK